MPPYGTREFRMMQITMYIRKSFLAEAPLESAVVAIAHELGHVVLNAVSHPLRSQEEAVDLTAMLLGFRDYFVTGVRYKKPLFGDCFYEYRLGYLTPEEVSHAAEYMTYR